MKLYYIIQLLISVLLVAAVLALGVAHIILGNMTIIGLLVWLAFLFLTVRLLICSWKEMKDNSDIY